MESQDVYEHIKTAFVVLKGALGLAKDVKDLLPAGKQKQLIESKLEAAEKESGLAEAQLAQSLGYHLCRCMFPPQIMLSIELNYPTHETFACPHCNSLKVHIFGHPDLV